VRATPTAAKHIHLSLSNPWSEEKWLRYVALCANHQTWQAAMGFPHEIDQVKWERGFPRWVSTTASVSCATRTCSGAG
jgi:hypothetical protein